MISRGWIPVARVLTWLYRSYALSRYRPNASPMSTWTSPYFFLTRFRTVFTARAARLPPACCVPEDAACCIRPVFALSLIVPPPFTDILPYVSMDCNEKTAVRFNWAARLFLRNLQKQVLHFTVLYAIVYTNGPAKKAGQIRICFKSGSNRAHRCAHIPGSNCTDGVHCPALPAQRDRVPDSRIHTFSEQKGGKGQ